jgi:uncharacterized protein (TIRG00374 family)
MPFSILAASILMAYVVINAGIGTLVHSIESVDKQYLVAALALYAGTLALGAGRWASIVGIVGKRARATRMLQFMLMDKAANSIFPTSAVGITVRTWLLEREYRLPKSKGLATIVMDYGADIAMTFFLSIPCYVIMRQSLPSSVQGPIELCLLLMGIAILALALMNIGPLRIVMHKGELATEHRLGSLMAKNKWGKKALEFVSTFRLAVHAPGGMAVALGFALGVRIIEAVRIYVLFKAFGIGVPAYALILIESAWFFISPFMATPGGIGAVESGKTALYAMVLGLSVPSVAPVVFVDRFITFWLMILVGTVVMLAYRKRESDDDGMHISFPFPTFSTGSTPSQVPARDEG